MPQKKLIYLGARRIRRKEKRMTKQNMARARAAQTTVRIMTPCI